MHLPITHFKNKEAKLVEVITSLLPVQKIYLLGNRLQQQPVNSIFMYNACCDSDADHYYLLVLTDKNSGYNNNQVQDKIENTCRSFISVTIIALNLQQFTNWLNEGHRFAMTVIKIAMLIYDGNKTPIKLPANTNLAAYLCHNENFYQQQQVVNEFIAGAELYIERKQNNMALFMLHQATEQALHLVLQKGTGLHINTHNIDKLIRYCSMVCCGVEQVFNRRNAKEQELLQLLQKAYVASRYKPGCQEAEENLHGILERVKLLQDVMHTFVEDKQA